MKEYEEIIYGKSDGIATITLNRPDRLNAIGFGMISELPDVIEDAQRDDDVRIVIVTGAGGGFCSGYDVATQAERSEGKAPDAVVRKEIWEPIGKLGLALYKLDKITIAAINGIAVGAGMALALLCDIRIASESARFCSIYTQRGLTPDYGLTWTLPRLVGISRALELMLLNDIIDANMAEQIGLVNKVVSDKDLMNVTKDISTKIANLPPIPIQFTKRLTNLGLVNRLEDHICIESDAAWRCFRSEDAKESAKAFKEKRVPVFKGM